MQPRVLVITVHYRSFEDCRECVQSIRNSTYRNWMHLILDNGSADDSVKKLSSWFSDQNLRVSESSILSHGIPDFEPGESMLLLHHENRGFAVGNNEILRRLSKEEDSFIWLLNPDVRVKENCMEVLTEEMHQNPRQLLGCSIFSWKNPSQFLHSGGFRINWLSGSVSPLKKPDSLPDYIYGASMMAPAAAFRDAGLFPEDYFLYWEESHWCRLAAECGYKLRLLPGAIVYDKVGSSTGRGFLAYYYYTRNGLRFFREFRPGSVPLVIMLNFARVLVKILSLKTSAAKGIWKGTLDFISGMTASKR